MNCKADACCPGAYSYCCHLQTLHQGKSDQHHCSVHPGFLWNEREWPCSVLQCLPLLQCQAFRYLNDRGSFGCPAHSRHTSRKSLYWPVTCQHNFILQTCGLLFCKSKLYAGLSVTFFIAYFSQLPYYSWSWPHKIYWVQRENLRDCKGDIGGGADNISCVLSHSLYWFSGLAWACLVEMLPLQLQIKVYYL